MKTDTTQYSYRLGQMQAKLFTAESRRLRRNQPKKVPDSARLAIYKLFYTEMVVSYGGLI